MNRKEGIVMVAVLLSTFIGGAYAAQNVPAIQQVFVTNFPKNQNVTVTNPTTTTTVVQNQVVQKNLVIVDKQNVTLACCNLQFLASSPINSTLGFRHAFIYFHWD